MTDNNIVNEKEVRKFLYKYRNPEILEVTTIKDGYVSCINPVPTLFGPTIHCSSKTCMEVRAMMLGFKDN